MYVFVRKIEETYERLIKFDHARQNAKTHRNLLKPLRGEKYRNKLSGESPKMQLSLYCVAYRGPRSARSASVLQHGIINGQKGENKTKKKQIREWREQQQN